MRGGSQKVTSDDEGEGGGVRIPPKNDDVIYEQPLSGAANIISSSGCTAKLLITFAIAWHNHLLTLASSSSPCQAKFSCAFFLLLMTCFADFLQHLG